MLVDRHRGRETVLADAYTDYDDAREQRRAVDDVLDHAGDADALEDHRELGRGAQRLSQPPNVPPRDGQPLQFLARPDRELQDGRGVDDVTVPLETREGRCQPRVDDNVGAACARELAAAR